MILIMLGAPGAGKGTVGKKLAKELGIIHISSGDIFRALIRDNTEEGTKIKEYIDKGLLIPDEMAMDIFERQLKKFNVEKGIILDGYPRTKNQAVHLDNIGVKVDAAVNIDLPHQIIVDRIINRRICSNSDCGEIYNLKYGRKPEKDGICDLCGSKLLHRDDDNETTVLERISVYEKTGEPLREYYKNKNNLINVNVDADSSADNTVRTIIMKLKEIKKI